jgi:hypothetical protein
VLYTLTERSVSVLRDTIDDHRVLLAKPQVVTVADMKLKHPESFIFPKKGKQTRFSVSQVVCLQEIIQEIQQQNPAPALLLIGLFDQALLNYDTRFGYRNTRGPYRVV